MAGTMKMRLPGGVSSSLCAVFFGISAEFFFMLEVAMPGRERRHELIANHSQDICKTFVSAAQQGGNDLVMWVIDSVDPQDITLFQTACKQNELRSSRDRVRLSPDHQGPHVLALPRSMSIAVAKEWSQTQYRVLERPAPPNSFHGVIIGGGGASFGQFKVP
jgi:hypothetical protein